MLARLKENGRREGRKRRDNLPTLVRLSLIVSFFFFFFFFFFVHDNEAEYFLSTDGRVGKK